MQERGWFKRREREDNLLQVINKHSFLHVSQKYQIKHKIIKDSNGF